MADFTFQERSTTDISVSQSAYYKQINKCSFVKFQAGYDGSITLDSTAEYLDSDGNTLIEGRMKVVKELVKDPNSDNRIYEIAIYDYGHNLIDENLNDVYRSVTVEDLIEDIVELYSLTFVNDLATASGITITKKVYKDIKPIDAVNELCKTIGAAWYVDNLNFHLFRRGEGVSSINLDSEWNNQKGWKDDTSKKATKVIVKGATILQRTTETVTGTGTEFTLARSPEDVQITGFEQTTESIDGDYEVDKQNKKVTFDATQTDPVINYSYYSQIRVEVGTGDVVKTLVKTYVESNIEARSLGRKYLAVYSDGVQSSVFNNVDVFGLDIRELICGEKINVVDSSDSNRDGEYVISKIIRKFPQKTEVTIGEDVEDIFDWQSESKDRIKQLEAKDSNDDYIQIDSFSTGTLTPKITGVITKLFVVINDGKILWASDTTLATDADLISDTGLDVDYALAYDDDGLPVGSYIDLTP